MTPGPWERHYEDIVAKPDGEFYVVCRADWRVSQDDPRWEADAKLIATAPDMLAMLLEIERLEDEASMGGDATPLGMAGNIRLGELLDRIRGAE